MNTITSSTSNTSVTTQALATPEVVTSPPAAAPVGKARVAVGVLTKATDANLLVAIQRILTGMTGNAAYPAPVPSLADITAARASYVAAVNAAKDSRMQIVVRKQQRAVVVALLQTLAHYVQVASGGDLPTLLSSGFTAQRSRHPVGPLPAPANLRLSRGSTSGQLIARCNKLRQAGAYDWRYATTAAPTAWIDAESTFAANISIHGLVPGTQYIVQARALGTAGPSNWSDPATLMAV